jgi:hypothetical protein
MNKQILFSLLLTSTALQSMELALSHPDICNLITTQIYIANNKNPKKTCGDIDSFSKTNKTLYKSREKIHQSIIRNVALQNNQDDLNTADAFGGIAIRNKINCLFGKIARKTLTKDDLHNAWYRNSTATYSCENGVKQKTLLVATIGAFDLEIAKFLLEADVNGNSTRCKENPLALMTNNRCFGEDDKQRIWFDIITLLLKNNLHPDSRISTDHPTLLHQAALWNDLPCTRLLLQYGADPYLPCKKYGNCNAFELERGEPKGWLAAMVYEVEKSKK